MNEAMRKLIDVVQQASPIVWQAAYRQVYIEGVELMIAVVVFGVLAPLLFRRARRATVSGPYDDGEEKIGYYVGSILSAVLFVICASEAVNRILNPTLEAIKNLKGLL